MLWSAKLVSKEIGKSIPLHSRVVSIAVHKVDTTRIRVLNTPSHLQSRDNILQGLITGRSDRFLVPDARRYDEALWQAFAAVRSATLRVSMWYYWSFSPREAAQMDSRQRVLLEMASEAFEQAGFPLHRCAAAAAASMWVCRASTMPTAAPTIWAPSTRPP
jgi:Beta-ketoacyl synthase, N-terminal domain